MATLLDCDARVAEKDRLYRALDRMVEHKEALEKHLAARWRDLFGASFDVLLYDLTSTYFEGDAAEVDKARRGYSRDQKARLQTDHFGAGRDAGRLPLSYEIFAGNRADVSTLEEMLEAVERKHGRARRVWVFDRGIVSEANLERLRARGGSYLVGTPRSALKAYEARLLEGDWQSVSAQVDVQHDRRRRRDLRAGPQPRSRPERRSDAFARGARADARFDQAAPAPSPRPAQRSRQTALACGRAPGTLSASPALS